MAVEHQISLVTTAQDQASGKFRQIGNAAAQMGQQTTQSLGKVRAGLGAVSLATAALGGESTSAFGQFTRFASGIAGSFAAGGPILGGLAAVTAGLGFLAERSRRAKEAEEQRAEAAKRAAEEAKRHADELAEAAKRQDEHNHKIQVEIELLEARNEVERQAIANREKLREAKEGGGSAGEALEARRQSAEAAAKRRAADMKAAEDSARRVADQAERAVEHERQLAERARETAKAFKDQVAERFRMLTMTAEQRQAADDAAAIAKLEASGEKEKADALRKAIEYAKELKKYNEDKDKSDDSRKKAADEAKRAQEEAKREAEARRSVVDALSEQLDIESQTTEEAKKRVSRLYEENRIRKEGGQEAVRLQRELWDLEEKRAAAARKAEEAKAASAKRERDAGAAGGAGIGLDTLDAQGNLVEGSLAGARQARKNAVRSQKRRRAAIGRGMGRSIHDGRMSGLGGIRSGRRGLGSFSDWYGGGGGGGVHEGGDPVEPSMREPGKPGKDGSPPKPPGYPDSGPAITPSDGGEGWKQAAENAGALAAGAEKAGEGAAKVAEGLGKAVEPMNKVGSSMDDARGSVDRVVTGVESLAEKVGTLADASSKGVEKINTAVQDVDKRLSNLMRQIEKAGLLSGVK